MNERLLLRKCTCYIGQVTVCTCCCLHVLYGCDVVTAPAGVLSPAPRAGVLQRRPFSPGMLAGADHNSESETEPENDKREY